MSAKKSESKQGFLAGARRIAPFTFLSRILGLIREQVFAYYFGAGFFTDAFQVAYRIPNLLRDLFAEGSMSAALVPTYTESRKKHGESHAWVLLHKLISILGVSTIAISCLGIFFADHLVDLYAQPMRAVPGKFELAVGLTKLMFFFFPTVVMAAIWMGALNAREKFAISAFAPALFNVASIFAAFFICPWMPYIGLEPIYGMGFGVLLGGLAQWLVQFPRLRQEGFRLRLNFRWKDPELMRILSLMGVGAIGGAATQINIVVTTFLASSQGDGAVSWLNYAVRLMHFPVGVFAVAIAQVTLTKVSIQKASEDLEGVRDSLLSSLRMAAAITIPSAVGLAVLAVPIVSVIFERGQFTAADTEATATVLVLYMVGMAAYASNKVLSPVFYSLKKARVPMLTTVATVLINILFCLYFIDELGYRGLALATSLSAVFQFGFLLLFAGVYLPRFPLLNLVKGVSQAIVAAALMGLALYFIWQSVAPYWSEFSFLMRLLILVVGLSFGVLTYCVIARSIRFQEVSLLIAFVFRPLRKIEKE